MPKPAHNLRVQIQRILEENYFLSEENVKGADDSNNGKILDGVLFHSFGFQILKEINYQGNFDEIIDRAKKRFEKQGWQFDEWDKGLW